MERLLDVLRARDISLASVIERNVGAPPELELVSQELSEPPHPGWISPPLPPDADLLRRCTRYRYRDAKLSYNLAYVDPAAAGPDLAGAIAEGRIHLGEVFEGPRVRKLGYEVGTDQDESGVRAAALDGCWGDGPQRPYAWRRYAAALQGTIAFVVLEILPAATWNGLLDPANIARASGDTG
ncbi:MAG: hypothetical protein H0W94_02370 [Actinobacteria bacterium]|nr:hypothetical protein [Actinomycetota bacterium]